MGRFRSLVVCGTLPAVPTHVNDCSHLSRGVSFELHVLGVVFDDKCNSSAALSDCATKRVSSASLLMCPPRMKNDGNDIELNDETDDEDMDTGQPTAHEHQEHMTTHLQIMV